MRKTIVLLIAFSLLLSACAGRARAEEQAGKEVHIKGEEMRYSRDAIGVKAGQEVTLVFENEGSLEHSLVIEELGVNIAHVQPDESGTAVFTPQTPGTYTYYCDLPGHLQTKMTGTLIVLPAEAEK